MTCEHSKKCGDCFSPEFVKSLEDKHEKALDLLKRLYDVVAPALVDTGDFDLAGEVADALGITREKLDKQVEFRRIAKAIGDMPTVLAVRNPQNYEDPEPLDDPMFQFRNGLCGEETPDGPCTLPDGHQYKK